MADDIDARIKSMRGMSPAQIRELQQKIGVNPDGKVGEGTINAYKAYLVEQERSAVRAAEQAKVDSKRAEQEARAAAERASADTAKQRAEAEKATAEAENARATAERERTQQARDAEVARAAKEKVDLAIKSTAYAVGAGGGFIASKFANKSVAKSITAAAPALASLADESRKLMPKAKAGSVAMTRLAGVVHTFDAQKLGRLRGPAGLILGASLIAEGIGARLLAGQESNETFQKMGNALGAASIAAGVTIIGKDLYARAAPAVRPNAAHVQSIEGARRLLAAGGQAPTAAAAGAELSKRGRGAVGPSVAELRTAAKEAGIRNASRMSKADIMAALEKAPAKPAAPVPAAASTPSKALAHAPAAPAAKVSTSMLGKVVSFAGRNFWPIHVGLSATMAGIDAYKSAKAGDSLGTTAVKTLASFGDNLLFGLPSLIKRATAKEATPEKAAEAPPEAKTDAQAFVEAAREGMAPVLAEKANEPWSALGPDRQAEGMRAIAEASNMTELFSHQGEHPDVTARGKYQEMTAEFARGAAARPVETSPPPVIPELAPQAPTGALRGFQLEHVREAALKARMAKQ